MMKPLRLLTLAIVCSGVAVWSACDSATPTAPSGTILTVSANPGRIALNGTSQIVVIGRRPDGNPLNEGTEIFFSTDRGSIAPAFATVDEQGVATAVLRGDGRAGAATVTATVGTRAGGGGGAGGAGGGGGTGGGSSAGVESVSVTVQIGEDPMDRPTVLLSASPSTIFVGETSEITVIARNADGSPVGSGRTVILTTTLGSISPNRPTTRSDGTATATLQAGSQPGTATVTAIVGSSEAATTTITIQGTATDINVIPEPSSVPSQGGTITVNAFVIDSQGEPVPGRQVTFGADIGGTYDNNVQFTDNQGRASAEFTVTQQQIGARSSFMVSAQTSTGSGDFIRADAPVDVEGQ